MKRKIIWLPVSCLMVAALLVTSCAPAVTEEEEVVTEEEYSAYVSRLGEVDLGTTGDDELETRDCPVAACPVR